MILKKKKKNNSNDNRNNNNNDIIILYYCTLKDSLRPVLPHRTLQAETIPEFPGASGSSIRCTWDP